LWLAIKDISLEDVIHTLSTLRFHQIFILTIINVAIFFTMTARWWLFIAASGYKIPYLRLIEFRLVGNAVSYFTPGPQFGGEPVQAYLLHRLPNDQKSSRIPLETAAASVFMDRLMELSANFSFLLIGMFCMISQQEPVILLGKKTLWIVSPLLLLPLGMLWVVCSGKQPFSRLLGLIATIPIRSYQLSQVWQSWEKLHSAIQKSERQAECICHQKRGVLWLAVAVSVFNWLSILGEFWIMYRFLGLSLRRIDLIIVLTAARLAFLTPLPGGFGALEASQVLILNALGFNPAFGLSACVVIRIRDLLTGCYGLWLTNRFLMRIPQEKNDLPGE
jgi:uncharacterized protein (TIRG00374 family)